MTEELEGVDVTEDSEPLPEDINNKIAKYQSESGKNVNMVIEVDGRTVYLSDMKYTNGKLNYNWFTYAELTPEEKNKMPEHIEYVIEHLVTENIEKAEKNKWSLRKLFSPIYSTIKNILQRFFRT